jgi:hypothetical protein
VLLQEQVTSWGEKIEKWGKWPFLWDMKKGFGEQAGTDKVDRNYTPDRASYN